MKVVCKRCGQEKDITEFNKHLRSGPLAPWNVRKCKECSHKEYVKRYATPARRKKQLKASAKWKKSNPEQHAALAREYRARNKDKIMAQNRLNYAVRKGIVERKPCEVCGSEDKVHAHHISYAPEDWYNVRWLCYVCHKLEHT